MRPSATSSSPLLRTPFRFLALSRLLAGIGDRLALVSTPVVVLRSGAGAATLGLVTAAILLPQATTTLIGGSLADRLSRRDLLRACDLGRGVAQALAGTLLLTHHSLLWVASAWCAAAVFGSGTRPAVLGLLPALVPGPRLAAANALVAAPESTGWLFGAPLAGLLLTVAGSGATFLVAACFIAGAAVPLRHISGAALTSHPAVVTAHARGGRVVLAEITRRRWVALVLGVQGLFGLLAVPALSVLGPVALGSARGAGSWAAVGTAIGAGNVAGMFVVGRLRPLRPALTACLLGLGGALIPALLALGLPTVVLCAAVALASAALFSGAVLYGASLQRGVQPHLLSRVVALEQAIEVSLVPVGSLLIGWLAAETSPRQTLLGCSALLLATLLVVASRPSIRAQREVALGADDEAPRVRR